MPRGINNSNHSAKQRLTRAKSHLFCTTLSPRPVTAADDTSFSPSFDVEYLLQLEIGGNIPTWISGPVVTENVKQLLKCATAFYSGTDPHHGLESYLLRRARTLSNTEGTYQPYSQLLLRPMETYMEGRQGLLMTF